MGESLQSTAGSCDHPLRSQHSFLLVEPLFSTPGRINDQIAYHIPAECDEAAHTVYKFKAPGTVPEIINAAH
jgi:hypothetical protein